MHEMGIASSVLETVHRELHRPGANRPERAAKVGLRIGEMAGVDSESLADFCFEALTKGTEFESLELEIERTDADDLAIAFIELDEAVRHNAASSREGSRMNRITVEQKVLSENDEVAARLRPSDDGRGHSGAELHRFTGRGQDHAARRDAEAPAGPHASRGAHRRHPDRK